MERDPWQGKTVEHKSKGNEEIASVSLQGGQGAVRLDGALLDELLNPNPHCYMAVKDHTMLLC